MNNEQNNLNQTPNAESLTPSPVIPPIEPVVSPAVTEPVMPVTPVAPEVPTAPVAPVTPIIEPIAPVVTEQPLPVVPEVPVTPVIPTEPVITPVVQEPSPAVTPVVEPVVASAPVDPISSPAPEGESFTAVSTPTVAPEPVATPAPALTVDPLLAGPNAQTVPATQPAPAPQKKKMNVKNIIIILVAVIALAVGGFFAYKYLMVTPHKVYKTFVSEIFAEGKRALGFDTDLNKSLLYSGDVMIETNMSQIKDFDKYSFNYQVGLDVPNKKIELEMGLNDNKNDLVSVGMYVFDNVAYLNSNELLEKIIKIGELEGFDWDQFVDVNTMKDVEHLYDRLSIAIQNMIPEDQIKSGKATIKVNGKDLKVTENYFEITSQNIKTIIENFINSFVNDDEVMSLLAGYTGMDASLLKTQLQSITTTMILPEESDEKVRISIYTKGKTTLAGYSVKLFDGEETLELVNAAFDNGVGKVVIGTEDANLTIDINNDTYNFSLYAYGEILTTGIYKKISDNQFELSMNIDDVILKINNTTTVSGNVTTNTLVYEASQGSETIKITLNNKLEVGATVGDVDVNNAGSVEDLDIEAIQEKLVEIFEGTPIYDILESYVFTPDGYIDEDYYSDYDDYYDDFYDDFEDEFSDMDSYF